MRLTLPLPYGELTVNISRTRKARPLFWCVLLSAAIHVLALSAIVRLAMLTFAPTVDRQPIIVSLSSATQIERRVRPRAAAAPARQPPQSRRRERPQAVAASNPAPKQPRPTPMPQTHKPAPQVAPKENLAEQLRQERAKLAQTAAQLSAQDNPEAGLATAKLRPEAPKRYALNLAGTEGKPQPEGILYPTKRWVEGAYVYYYVRYLVNYSDGTTESGSVPWPIRFAVAADPFARGLHHLPLPGPPGGFVLPSDVSVEPLVQNCYDHRYQYCPIEK
jgi:hypothetical protein